MTSQYKPQGYWLDLVRHQPDWRYSNDHAPCFYAAGSSEYVACDVITGGTCASNALWEVAPTKQVNMNNDEQQPSTSHLPSNQRSAQSPPRWPDGHHRNHSTHRYHPYHQHDHPVHQASTSMHGHGSNYTQLQHEQQPSTSRFPLNQPRTQSPSQWHPNRNLLSSSMMQPQIYERISSFPPPITSHQQAAQNPTFYSSHHHQLMHLSPIFYPQQTGRPEHEVQASSSMHGHGSNHSQRQHEQQPSPSRFPLDQPSTQFPAQLPPLHPSYEWNPRINPLHPPIMQPPPQQIVPGSWFPPFSHLHAQEPNCNAPPHEKQNQFQPWKFQSHQLPSTSFSHPQNCVPRIPHLQGFSPMAFLPHEAYRDDAVASQIFQPVPQSETRCRAESETPNCQSTNMQSSSSSNRVSDNQIQDSNLIQGNHGPVNINQNQYNVTQQHQHDENFVSDVDGKKAIDEVLKCQERFLECDGDLHFQGSGLCQDNIPIVHPSITKTNFYSGGAARKEEEYKPSSINDSKRFHPAGNTQFKDILRDSGMSRLISIVGIPGAGKTTLSKRLVRSGNKATNHFWFHKKFMDMDYKSEKLTVRELFFDKSYPELDKKTSFNAFAWVKKNGHKCTFVFDGLDQAEFKLNENPPKQDYDTPCKVEDLFSNLCCGHYLPRSRIIITSRSHSLIVLPQNMRPGTTYQLGDLAFDDMKDLFWAYAGTKADELWRKLDSEARHLLPLCHNPLLLQLVISAGLDPSSKVGEMFTLTRLFESLKDNLKYSKNVQDVKLLNELLPSIAELAFRATSKGTVVITVDQLKDVGLDPSNVHDIIVQLFTCKDFTNCFRVFDGNTRLYFSHQSFQEYFAAYHIVYNMMKDEFEKFVEEKLFKDHWAVVRRFVCGFLIDLEANSKTDLEEKTEILKINLIQQLTIISERVNSSNRDRISHRNIVDELNTPRLFDLYACVGEGKDSSIATKAAEHFPRILKLPQAINSNLVPGFCFVMKHVTKQLDWLSLSGCYMDADSFHEIASVIKEMKPGQIGKMNIMFNYLQPSNIDDVIGLLRVVRDELWMWDCFDDDDDDGTDGGDGDGDGRDYMRGRFANQDERRKIQRVLNKLQTGLKVDVGDTTLRSQKRIGMNETNSKKR
ncbi:unnamed protein product [Clavelina lepadiformis]|uniref:NACHT domain-containing protein n=1 Tax=Clavelina lepadiformis TaxID=159417 RepID=A0ABP0FMX7_CLALP